MFSIKKHHIVLILSLSTGLLNFTPFAQAMKRLHSERSEDSSSSSSSIESISSHDASFSLPSAQLKKRKVLDDADDQGSLDNSSTPVLPSSSNSSAILHSSSPIALETTSGSSSPTVTSSSSSSLPLANIPNHIKSVEEILGLHKPISLEKICRDFEDKDTYPEYPGRSALGVQQLKKPQAYFTQAQFSALVHAYITRAEAEIKKCPPYIQYPTIQLHQIIKGNAATLHQKTTAPQDSHIAVMGDNHGSGHSLLRVFYDMYQRNILKDDFTLKPNYSFQCLGDGVDRGAYGIDVLALFLILKLKNWKFVVLGRGNHEEECIYRTYGLINTYIMPSANTSSTTTTTTLPKPMPTIIPGEISYKYGSDTENGFIQMLNQLFALFPSACWTQTPYGWILSTHGGFDPVTLPKVRDQLLNTNKPPFTLIISGENISNKYTWYDVIAQNNKIYMLDKRNTGLHVVEDVLSIMKQYDIIAWSRGHNHFDYNMMLLSMNPPSPIPSSQQSFNHPSLVDWKRIYPSQTVIPLSISIPIFTLSTATEIIRGPQKASYAIININDSLENCTIMPVEIDFLPNKIIPQTKSQADNGDSQIDDEITINPLYNQNNVGTNDTNNVDDEITINNNPTVNINDDNDDANEITINPQASIIQITDDNDDAPTTSSSKPPLFHASSTLH